MTDSFPYDRQAQECKARYGFWLGPGPADALFVYIPAGFDPNDGAPLTYAREATPDEANAWTVGNEDRLAALVGMAPPPMTVQPMRAPARPPGKKIGMRELIRRGVQRLFGGRR